MEITLTLEEINNVSEIDIVYRTNEHLKLSDRPQIRGSQDTYKILMHYWNIDKINLIEEFKVMYLNKGNRVLRILPLSTGGITATVADTRLILAPALILPTSSIVLAHNHPSGMLKPSAGDKNMTEIIYQAAALFEIRILDHIILSESGYYSFADEGLL